MNEERRPVSHSGSARLLITFFLGVCVGMSLLHAWHTSQAPESEQLAQNTGADEPAPGEAAPQPEAPIPTPDPPAATGDPSPAPVSEAAEAAQQTADPIEEPEAAPDEAETDPAPEVEPEPEPDPSHADLHGLWPARYLFVGLPGPELDDETRAWLAEFKPGGILLRPENILTDWQLRDLMAEVRYIVGLGEDRTDLPLFAIAQEGGPQANPLRLDDAPSTEALGRAAAPDLAAALDGDSPDLAAVETAVAPIRETAARYARNAREQGFAVLLAPVLDVFRPGQSDPRLRDRTFSTDAERVSLCGQAFHDGVLSEDVIPVVKHYPGLGAAKALADGTLVILESDKQLLAGEIFLPFALAAEWPAAGMLVAPVAVPVLDQSGRMATVSPRITGSVLREMWNFDGVVLAGNTDNLPPGEAFAGALAAGCDAVVIEVGDGDTLNACGAALAQAVAEGKLTEDALAAKRKRLEVWQTRIGGTPGRVPPEPAEVEPAPDEMTAPPEEEAAPPVPEETVPPEEQETESTEETGDAQPAEEETEAPEESLAPSAEETETASTQETESTPAEEPEPAEETASPAETETVEPPTDETAAPPSEEAPEDTTEPPVEEPVPTDDADTAVTPQSGVTSETATPSDTTEADTDAAPEEAETGQETATGTEPQADNEETTGENAESETPLDTEVTTETSDAEPEDTDTEEPPAEPAETEAEETPTPEPLEPAQQPEGTKRIDHTIRRGDTLNAIARLYRVSVADLMAWNALTDGNIKFGFNLIVYVPEERFEEALEAGPEDLSYYTIQPGDKLSEVAARFGLTEEALIQLNGLTNPDRILTGQRLKVPKQPPTQPDNSENEEDGEDPEEAPEPESP